MYSESVKNRAYTLFLQGKNPEQIADVLKESYPKITANTIRAWAEKTDESGDTWTEKREEVGRHIRKHIEENSATVRSRIKMKANTLTQAVYDKVVNEAGKALIDAKDLTGVTFALQSMFKFQLQLDDEEQNRFNPLQAAQMIMDTLNEFPGVRKEIKAIWPQFQKKLTARLDMATHTKEIEAKVTVYPKD